MRWTDPKLFLVLGMGVAVLAGAAACGTDAAAIAGASDDDGGTFEDDANASGTGSRSDGGNDAATGSPSDSGNEAVTDANPGCASVTCGANATCSAASGTPLCTCNPGFAGDGGACSNIDDCTGTPCANGGTCVDGVSGFTCTCAAGYSGTTCETDIDDCPNVNPCLNGGTCVDSINAYSCECANGYSGTTCAVLPPTCNAIKLANGGATTGVYTVDPDGSAGDDPFQVFCDMTTDGGGWTSVYKTSAGADVEATGLWTSAEPVNAAAADCSDPTTSGASSYCVNSFVTKFWNANGITLNGARVHAYKAGAIGAFLRFDALTTDKIAWFGSSLVSSSWSDLAVGSPNYFSLGGDAQFGRTFFVNHNYNGCGNDAGWLVVSSIGGGQNKPCSWEQAAGAKTRILYSTGTTYANWTSGPITAADTFMVFVR